MTRRQRWLGVIVSAGLIASACGDDASYEEAPGMPVRSAAETVPGTSTGSASSPSGGSAKDAAARPTAPITATPAPAAAGSAAAPAMASGTPPSGPAAAPPSPRDPSAAPAGDEDADSGGEKPADRPGQPSQSGVLTAGAWDDNRNYDRFKRYRKRLLTTLSGALSTTDEEHDAANQRFAGDREARQQLDIALVIDTTGSMGDEISFLQTEFLALSQAIESAYPDSDQRWAMVVYRDERDEYVTRQFEFESDVGLFRERLSMQHAAGGGDFPEAPDAAFEAMAQLSWREGDGVARLVFWVADAPHHAENERAMTEAIRTSAELDLHVYPVASSGIDEVTELSMRSAAQLTGGRYLFLTDDSGVGGAHKEPTIPCYFVTRLDQAILRMVSIELSGEYREPDADDVIRTGGEPKSGRCTLESGEEVQSF